MLSIFIATTALVSLQDAAQVSRRTLVAAAASSVVGGGHFSALADEPIAMVTLTEEEMAARVARKQELLRAQARGGGGTSSRGMDGAMRSDVNPEAAVSLRSKSVIDNAKSSLQKQEELKKRNKAQKREDLCEMLGRGC